MSEKTWHNSIEIIIFSCAFPAGWIINNEDALHMMHCSVSYYDILSMVENLINSLK